MQRKRSPNYKNIVRLWPILLLAVIAVLAIRTPVYDSPVSMPASQPDEAWNCPPAVSYIDKTQSFQLPSGSIGLDLPAFVSLNSTSLSITPTSENYGSYELKFSWNNHTYSCDHSVRMAAVAEDPLIAELKTILGNKLGKFGIYIKDLKRDQAIELQATKVLPIGSVGKVPVVILTLLDIDKGKRSFDETYAVKDSLKHTRTDSIGVLPAGAKVTIRKLIEATIIESNNTAMYHLRDMLGGWQIVHERTRAELGVDTFQDAPSNIGVPADIGKVYEKLYRETLLSHENSQYLIGLMKRTLPDLRLAIPKGTPVEAIVANKIGFLWGKGVECYVDTAIVYGKKTDYVLVILDEKTTVAEGQQVLPKLAEAVYRYLN